jgi:hypothetical protein
MKTLAFILTLAVASTALATPPKWQDEANAETCAASWEERLADFRAAIPAQQRYMKAYNRVMPWFYEHCRWLSELEVAIRKLDDTASFVCDTKKGRPKELTSDFALEHQGPEHASIFIEYFEANRLCQDFDAAERVSLLFGQFDSEAEQARVILTGMCWHVSSANCDKARPFLQ